MSRGNYEYGKNLFDYGITNTETHSDVDQSTQVVRCATGSTVAEPWVDRGEGANIPLIRWRRAEWTTREKRRGREWRREGRMRVFMWRIEVIEILNYPLFDRWIRFAMQIEFLLKFGIFP